MSQKLTAQGGEVPVLSQGMDPTVPAAQDISPLTGDSLHQLSRFQSVVSRFTGGFLNRNGGEDHEPSRLTDNTRKVLRYGAVAVVGVLGFGTAGANAANSIPHEVVFPPVFPSAKTVASKAKCNPSAGPHVSPANIKILGSTTSEQFFEKISLKVDNATHPFSLRVSVPSDNISGKETINAVPCGKAELLSVILQENRSPGNHNAVQKLSRGISFKFTSVGSSHVVAPPQFATLNVIPL